KRTFIGTALNPNVYGVIIVGLGCEDAGAEEIANRIKSSTNKPVHVFSIQDYGDTEKAIKHGADIATNLVNDSKKLDRQPNGLEDIKIGFVNDSEKSLATYTIKKLLDKNATLVLSNISDEPTDYLQEREGHLQSDIPTKTINYAENIHNDEYGVFFMNSPSQVLEQITGIASTGVHLIVAITNEPFILGSPIVPVLNVCYDRQIYNDFSEDIDMYMDSESPSEILLENIIKILSGKQTKGEIAEINDYGIQRIGPSI